MKSQWLGLCASALVAFASSSVLAQRAFLESASDGSKLKLERDNPTKKFRVVDADTKLNVIVRVGEGHPVPDALKKFALATDALDHRRLRIDGAEMAAIQMALADPEMHVEFERPNAILRPIVEMAPENRDARISHLMPEFEAAFPGVRGSRVTIAVFDEGQVRASHQEFREARVVVRTTHGLSKHSTHCAGTIGARGVNGLAMGMATQARIASYDWENVEVNLNRDAAAIQVSSHSYGPLSGWVPDNPMKGMWNWWGGPNDVEDARYGKYTEDCSLLDEVLSKNAGVISFFAAGNDRDMGPRRQPVRHYVVATEADSVRERTRIGGDTGLDSISGGGLAKNSVCVGAIEDIRKGGGQSEIQITSFSGVGPADDGRIKPDLVANGLQLYSTSEVADDAYAEMSGTSMATPTASGIAACLSELFEQTFARKPTSAEIKACLIHTARDGGVPGPDPQYGWGSIDAFAAGKLIHAGAASGRCLIGDPLVNVVPAGETRLFSFVATGEPIRVTITWIDPPGSPNAGGIDDSTPALQNDLDLRLVSPSGTVYLPYSLDLANLWSIPAGTPSIARTDRPNRVDNVEMVNAPSAAGTWTIEVVGTKFAQGNATQSFAMAVSGLKSNP